MIKKKVCMLGAFAVGKTSLVQRYVHSIFDDRYKTTLGVKIDKKLVTLNQHSIELILWDLAGEDEFMKVRNSYLRGSSAVILVADGTRAETLDIAVQLKQKIDDEVGPIPFILIINKNDLRQNWAIDKERLQKLEVENWDIIETSAKQNKHVDQAFLRLASQLVKE